MADINHIIKAFICVQIAGVMLLRAFIYFQKPHEHSFLGDDYPTTWTIGTAMQEQIATPFDRESFHFQLDLDMGLANGIWDSYFPGKGLIKLGPHQQTFSISMFHQLRCLSHIRSDTIQRQQHPNSTLENSQLTYHCINYIRQMVLCRADVDIETGLYLPHLKAYMDVPYRCSNTKTLYDALLDNQKRH
ncbi:hypothetical protein CPC08DRAFT_676584, partial [Agrocybe pediades]